MEKEDHTIEPGQPQCLPSANAPKCLPNAAKRWLEFLEKPDSEDLATRYLGPYEDSRHFTGNIIGHVGIRAIYEKLFRVPNQKH